MTYSRKVNSLKVRAQKLAIAKVILSEVNNNKTKVYKLLSETVKVKRLN